LKYHRDLKMKSRKLIYILFLIIVYVLADTAGSYMYAQTPKDTTTVKKEITVESDDLGMFGVAIKPNPAKEFIVITFDPELFRGDIKIIISNIKGKQIFEKVYKEGTIKNSRVKIDVETYKKGLYKVEIVTLEVSLELAFRKI